MKVRLEQIPCEEDEVILRYREMNEKINGIIRYVNEQSEKIVGIEDGKNYVINIQDILYIETVDNNTYAYTDKRVVKVPFSLSEFHLQYEKMGFFRCSKSMVLNIYKIDTLKSEAGNRIDAAMNNGEHVMISRRYAKELRMILKKGR